MPTNITFDPSLVTPWSLDLINEEPYEYPFIAHYKLENKKLTYVAALHSYEMDSGTFRALRHVFETEDVEFAILEGLNNSDGISPDRIVDWANKQRNEGQYKGFETAFAVTLADQRNVPFTGGEPDDIFVSSQLQSKGFSPTDYVFYGCLQQIYQLQENQKISGADPLSEFDGLMRRKTKSLGLAKIPAFSDFATWYFEKNGRPFAFSEIPSEVTAPFENGELFTQRISSAVCGIRDRFVVARVAHAMTQYDSVLVCFGGSHWSTQKRSLEAALGSPNFTKW